MEGCHAFHFLLAVFAGWVNRRQQYVIGYLEAENKCLREQMGNRKISFSDYQRRRLAGSGKKLKPEDRRRYVSLVTPETLLRWHRKLIARKWTFAKKKKQDVRRGRPGVSGHLETMIVKMAEENSGWGYRRIQGELAKLEFEVSHQAVANILKANGLEPAPTRKTKKSWNDFFRQHHDALWGTDFFTTEVWTSAGLTTFYVLFFIHVKSRRVVLGGVTQHPHTEWMKNIARQLTWDGGEMEQPGIVIHDRDTKYSSAWENVFRRSGWETVKLPPKSPNLNAPAERFVRSIKEECLEHLILIGERSLKRAVTKYIEHYHQERPHQGIGNVVPFPGAETGAHQPDEEVLFEETGLVRRSKLGGLLNSYQRVA